MKRFLIVVMCLIICCSVALAEESMNLGAEGNDEMKYAFTLPDRRMLFVGSRGEPGNYQESRARLLCLNLDRTVSWEYLDSATGNARYNGAAFLPDGTIGVVYTNSPLQRSEAIEIRKFSINGVPIGESIDIFNHGEASDLVNAITPYCILKKIFSEDGKEQRGFLDWNGNLMFSFGRKETIGPYKVLATDGALVLAGCEVGTASNAKIMKVDLAGNMIWETVLPMMMVNGARAWIDQCVETADGGFLAWVIESDANSDQWAHALVRFDANGRILWQNKESFDNTPVIGCADLIEYRNMSVMLVRNETHSIAAPSVYLWFDENGKKIGQTELLIPREDAKPLSNEDNVEVIPHGMLIMEDGLWTLYDIRIENAVILKEMDSVDDILYKVPEIY